MKHLLDLSPLSDQLPFGSNTHIYQTHYSIFHTPEPCYVLDPEHPDEALITTKGAQFYDDCASDYGYEKEIRAEGYVVIQHLPHGCERAWGAASNVETALLLALHLHNVHEYSQGEHDNEPPVVGHLDDEERASKLRTMYPSVLKRLQKLVYPSLP